MTKGADGVYGGLEGVNNFSLANGVLKNYKMPAAPDDPQDPDWHVPAPLQDAVDRMLSKGYHKTWGTFASTKWRGDNAEGVTQYLSLEQIHNKLHVRTFHASSTMMILQSCRLTKHIDSSSLEAINTQAQVPSVICAASPLPLSIQFSGCITGEFPL